MIRHWIGITLAGLIPGVFAASFLAMAWIRSQQGHSGQYTSEIQSLAVRREPADPLTDALARGGKIYRHYCRICHGEEGKGDGFNSYNIEPPPRNLADEGFWQQTTDERVYYAVSQGGGSVGKSVLMPAWGHTLTDRQIRDVIAFVRALAGQPTAEKRPHQRDRTLLTFLVRERRMISFD